MTLNNLIDDVLLEARNSSISESEHLSRRQIELWINTYRALLIKQQIDKDHHINPLFAMTINMHISKIQETDNHYVFKGDDELPKLIDFNKRSGILNVKDLFGNIIQLGSETKMKFQKYRKFTCKDYIAYLKNNYIYVEGNDLLENVEITLIPENPTDFVKCYDPDKDEYPLPMTMWPAIKQFIFERDIPTLIQAITDDTNNSKDETQNRIAQK